MAFEGLKIAVLDLETAHSAADQATGWADKAALGLSIGGYYAYWLDRIVWFDQSTLLKTMQRLVEDQPLIVSFNGQSFDAEVMAAVLQDAHPAPDADWHPGGVLNGLLVEWTRLWARSYDILAEVLAADPQSRNVRGQNGLDALCAANGLRRKTGAGEQAPRLWQAGRVADVCNYCANDIYMTKDLLECIARRKGELLRATGSLQIRHVCTRYSHHGSVPRIVMECLDRPEEEGIE